MLNLSFIKYCIIYSIQQRRRDICKNTPLTKLTNTDDLLSDKCNYLIKYIN